MTATKVATCCYCGTRAALVLRGDQRHELSCAQCGAPLHDLKIMPVRASGASARAATPARPARTLRADFPNRPQKTRRKKSRKRAMRSLIEDLWDVVEDIFD
ncbi:hypothetical protein [Loktanella sp. SALINAS62]|uniref:hypothetical protein n=1 Tax=Loktanella sp. SALINAS62 TaxID=2706124 RepID=UPI001B8BC9A8|nr:hypothetical protein [Loktanella sp. SALINAS62]MBS1303849.1 hypothetical protein [Loktanella sp. SALINAS62]